MRTCGSADSGPAQPGWSPCDDSQVNTLLLLCRSSPTRALAAAVRCRESAARGVCVLHRAVGCRTASLEAERSASLAAENHQPLAECAPTLHAGRQYSPSHLVVPAEPGPPSHQVPPLWAVAAGRSRRRDDEGEGALLRAGAGGGWGDVRASVCTWRDSLETAAIAHTRQTC